MFPRPPSPDSEVPSAARKTGREPPTLRSLAVRRTIAALLGSGGWLLVAYVAILGRRYHVAGPIVFAVIALYTWAFWFFVVRRF